MSTGPVIKGEDRPHGFARGPFAKTSPLPSENDEAKGELREALNQAVGKLSRWAFQDGCDASLTGHTYSSRRKAAEELWALIERALK